MNCHFQIGRVILSRRHGSPWIVNRLHVVGHQLHIAALSNL